MKILVCLPSLQMLCELLIYKQKSLIVVDTLNSFEFNSR